MLRQFLLTKSAGFPKLRAMSIPTGLQAAIDQAGGVSALARLLSIKPPSIYDWIETRVPLERCIEIEAALGVRVEEIRPDVPWHVIRAKPVGAENCPA